MAASTHGVVTTRRSKRPGRPAVLSKAAILKAAAEIDLEDLSMPGVAARLGVTHSALYNYFSSKRELVAALVEERLTEIEVPARDGRPWQEWLLDAAQSLRILVASTMQPEGYPAATAAAHPLVDAIAEILLEAGFTPGQAYELYLHIGACCTGVVAFARRIERYGPYTKDHVGDYLSGVGFEASPITAFIEPIANLDLDRWFKEQVRLVIDAFEQRLTGKPH